MIETIIDTFKQQAREHKTIQAFYYNRTNEQGSGKEIYPLFWLEDPLVGRNIDNIFRSSANFSILFVPSQHDSIEHLQNMAFSIGLNILERIKSNSNSLITIEPNWSYFTLRDYYDDAACGCRFSVNFIQRNMQNICLIEEQFAGDIDFEVKHGLKQFDVLPSNACEIFTNKLPEFDLKIRKE